VQAIAHFRLEEVGQARGLLAKAAAPIPPQNRTMAVPDRIGIQLLLREAEALIGGAPDQPGGVGAR
jgi:hypothetical protein